MNKTYNVDVCCMDLRYSNYNVQLSMDIKLLDQQRFHRDDYAVASNIRSLQPHEALLVIGNQLSGVL